MSSDRALMCPSVPAHYPDAVAFGVVTGSTDAPDMVPLIPPLPVTDELLAMAAPVSPGEVFRFAGRCIQDGCRHWEGNTQRCRLVAKTVALAPVVVEKLKPCAIRSDCRWWRQEGKAACVRCPQVASSDPSRTGVMKLAASPVYDDGDSPAPAA
jgi:hypothetical protein